MSTQLEGHTFRRFDGEMHHLHTEVLQMAGLVYEQVVRALDLFQNHNMDTVRLINDRESEVDALEKKIDLRIAELLAKRSPVARDLRAILAFSKGVTDLERLGDEAAKIAFIAASMYDNEHNSPSNYLLRDVNLMGKTACAKLKEAIEILDVIDLDRAERLVGCQEELEEEFQAGLRRLTTYMLEDARNVGYIINIVLIMKSMVRIGSHARNLAEYIIYMISGEDIRHIENIQV